MALSNYWAVFDNSGLSPRLVAESHGSNLRVVDTGIFGKIQATETNNESDER